MCACVFCGACLHFHKSRISICRLPVYEKLVLSNIPKVSLLGDFMIQVCVGGVGCECECECVGWEGRMQVRMCVGGVCMTLTVRQGVC